MEQLRDEYEQLRLENGWEEWPTSGGDYMQIDMCYRNVMAAIREGRSVPLNVVTFLDKLNKAKADYLYEKMNTNVGDASRNLVLLELAKDLRMQQQMERERAKRLELEAKHQRAAYSTADQLVSGEAPVIDESKIVSLKEEISRLQAELTSIKQKHDVCSVDIPNKNVSCDDAIKQASDEFKKLKEEYKQLHDATCSSTTTDVQYVPSTEPDDDIRQQKEQINVLYKHAESFILGTLDVIREVANSTILTNEQVAQYMCDGTPDKYLDMLRHALQACK